MSDDNSSARWRLMLVMSRGRGLVLSQSVEYALRAVATIAQHDGGPCTSHMISEITKVPGPYLSKLMQGLVRAGILKSQRGRHGGFVLLANPDQLSVWQIIEAVDPIKRIEECPLGIRAHRDQLCPLHHRLDAVLEQVERAFRETTIQELLRENGTVTPLCDDNPVVSIETNAAPRKRSRKRRSR